MKPVAEFVNGKAPEPDFPAIVAGTRNPASASRRRTFCFKLLIGTQEMKA
jgi:hypothetical protein